MSESDIRLGSLAGESERADVVDNNEIQPAACEESSVLMPGSGGGRGSAVIGGSHEGLLASASPSIQSAEALAHESERKAHYAKLGSTFTVNSNNSGGGGGGKRASILSISRRKPSTDTGKSPVPSDHSDSPTQAPTPTSPVPVGDEHCSAIVESSPLSSLEVSKQIDFAAEAGVFTESTVPHAPVVAEAANPTEVVNDTGSIDLAGAADTTAADTTAAGESHVPSTPMQLETGAGIDDDHSLKNVTNCEVQSPSKDNDNSGESRLVEDHDSDMQDMLASPPKHPGRSASLRMSTGSVNHSGADVHAGPSRRISTGTVLGRGDKTPDKDTPSSRPKSMKEIFEDKMREQNEEKKKRLRELNLTYKIPVSASALESTQSPTKDEIDDPGQHKVEEVELSLAERRIQALKEAKAAKEARLSQYLVNTGDTAGHSVKERYEQARLAQREAETGRLEKFKNMSNERRQSSPKGNFENFWGDVVSNSVNTANQRADATKQKTRSQFRTTDGTGFVKRRIGQWEELFMCMVPSGPQLLETVRMANLLIVEHMERKARRKLDRQTRRDNGEEVDGDSDDDEEALQNGSRQNPEVFVIGSTHIYSSRVLDPSTVEYLNKALKAAKSRSFPCGAYGEGKLSIEVVAAALRVESDVYIALTIHAKEGHEKDANSYGVKRVAMFEAPRGGENIEKVSIFERIVDIVPVEGWNEFLDNLDENDQDLSASAPPSTANSPRADQEQLMSEPTSSENSPRADGSAFETVILDALKLSDEEVTTELPATVAKDPDADGTGDANDTADSADVADAAGVSTLSLAADAPEIVCEQEPAVTVPSEAAPENEAKQPAEASVVSPLSDSTLSMSVSDASPGWKTLSDLVQRGPGPSDRFADTSLLSESSDSAAATPQPPSNMAAAMTPDKPAEQLLQTPTSPPPPSQVMGKPPLRRLSGASITASPAGPVIPSSAASTLEEDFCDDLTSVGGGDNTGSPFNFGRAASVANVKNAKVHKPIDKKRYLLNVKVTHVSLFMDCVVSVQAIICS
jgi:hypothetical protein